MEITTKNMAVLQEANLSEAVNQVTMQADGTKTRTLRLLEFKSFVYFNEAQVPLI